MQNDGHLFTNALARVRPRARDALRQAAGANRARRLLDSWRKGDPQLAADLMMIGCYVAIQDVAAKPGEAGTGGREVPTG